MKQILKADLSSPTHAESVVLLLDSYASDIMGGGCGLAEFTRANLIDELRKIPGCVVVLAFVDERPAGLAICFEAFSTFLCRKILNIHDLAVTPEFRGQGLSVDLLKKVEEIAVASGCGKLTLEVLEGNKIAQHVYQKFGFGAYELDPQMGRALFFEKKLAGSEVSPV